MNLKLVLFVTFLVLGGMQSKAQEQTEIVIARDSSDFIGQLEQEADSMGRIRIYQDERIRKLLKTDKEVNSQNPWFPGYRIQIFSGRSVEKEKAMAVKDQFRELYPGVPVYVVYKAPDFRVRVGNFRTKLESIQLYMAIKKDFPNCYPVKTTIRFSDLEPQKEDVTVTVEEMLEEEQD